EWSQGAHTVSISPTFPDFQQQYYLVAKVDSAGSQAESNEGNNTLKFWGGAFLAHEADTGQTILQIQGRGGALPSGAYVVPNYNEFWSVFVPSAEFVLPSTAPSAPAAFGDVNGDGRLTGADAGAVYNGLSNSQATWHNPLDRFDVNG